MKTLVTIATYKRSMTACFLKEKLENENINCFFILSGRMKEGKEQVRVQVKSEDVERVIKVMMGIKEEYGKDIEEIELVPKSRKIIVPTDFSKGSEDACHYAIGLARKLQAEIKLLHVFENPIGDLKMKSSTTFEDIALDVALEAEEKAKQKLVKFTNKINTYIAEKNIEGISIHSAITMGPIMRKMKEVCTAYEPDVVVLGTVGRREGTKSVLAGVAKELVNGLRIPVYAIPSPRPEEDFQEMKILYATDFNENDHSSLDQLLEIMRPFRKQVTCIHIDTSHNPVKEERMDELNDFLDKEYGQHEIQCRLIDYVDVFLGIKDFANSNNMNLLSFTIHRMGIFNKLFMPNLFKKILQEAKLPILIFPS